MHITLTTIGTAGDFEPFLRLALGLKARGHQLQLCTHARYQRRCEAHGIGFVQVGPQMDDEAIQRVGRQTANAKDIFQQLAILRDFFLAEAEADDEALAKAFQGTDVVICHTIHNIAQAAAAALGIPWLRVQLEPSAIPTAHAAPPPLPSLGKPINRWLWRMVEAQLAKLDRPLIALLQKLKGQSPATRLFRTESPHLNLVACSSHISTFYDDIPAKTLVTGAWLATPDHTYQPPETLAAFLQAHPKPLVFSFGSMVGKDAAQTSRIILEAIKKLRHPAIIQQGAAGLEVQTPHPDVLVWDFVPHTYLFPRAACVIHHGGAGTLATACAAGVPSLVVPHLGDQFYWGQRVYRCGIGPKALPLKLLTSGRLATRLQQIMDSPTMANNAQQLAQKMQQERGVDAAIDAIEQWSKAHRDGSDDPSSPKA